MVAAAAKVFEGGDRPVTLDDMLLTSCMMCGHKDRKKNLVRIGARTGNYFAMRVIGHVCPDCFKKICAAAGVDPERYD